MLPAYARNIFRIFFVNDANFASFELLWFDFYKSNQVFAGPSINIVFGDLEKQTLHIANKINGAETQWTLGDSFHLM